MSKLIVLLFVAVLVYVNARHIHPHGELHRTPHVEEPWKNEIEGEEKSAAIKEEIVNVEVLEEVPRHLKPNRFMPPNNAFFFMAHRPQPCAEEGFKRDYMGICREVWD